MRNLESLAELKKQGKMRIDEEIILYVRVFCRMNFWI